MAEQSDLEKRLRKAASPTEYAGEALLLEAANALALHQCQFDLGREFAAAQAARIAELERERDEMHIAGLRQAIELQAAKARIAELERERDENLQLATDLTESCTMLRARAEAAEARIAELERVRAELERELALLRQHNTSRERDLESLGKKLDQAERNWAREQVDRDHKAELAGKLHVRAHEAEQRAEAAERELARVENQGAAMAADRMYSDDKRALNEQIAAHSTRIAELEDLLRRIVKYATEDRATTPGVTRLARALDEARKLLAEPAQTEETTRCLHPLERCPLTNELVCQCQCTRCV